MNDLNKTQEPFVLASEVKAGDFLITDGGFTCLPKGKECQVHLDPQYAGAPDEFVGLYIE